MGDLPEENITLEQGTMIGKYQVIKMLTPPSTSEIGYHAMDTQTGQSVYLQVHN